MPYKTDLANFIADWWQFGAFIAVSVIAFLGGRERQRYKVDEIGRDVCALKADLKEVRKELANMHEQDGAEAVSAAKAITELATDVRYLRRMMDELRAELRGKADK